MARTNISPPSRQNYIIPDGLSHNSGVITASVFGSNYQANLSGLAANTRYFLYLLNGTLQYTTTVPSTYRSSNPTAILVGAFQSNGLSSVAFGAFINIEGAPRSNPIPFLPTGSWVSNTTYTGQYFIDGDYAEFEFNVALSGAPTATALLLNLPMTVDENKFTNPTGTALPNYGIANALCGGNLQGAVYPTRNGATQLSVWSIPQTSGAGHNTTQVSSTNPATFVNTDWVNVKRVRLPISGFTNQPLKDL